MPTPMPYRVPNKFIGGLINKFLPKLPKAFRKFLEAHKDEPLESIVIYRSPLDKVSTTFLQFLTAGNWEEIKRRGGVDKLFHTYAIINDKYFYEKTAVPQFKMASNADKSREGAEEKNVAVKNITIGQFIENAIKKMGDNYHTYDGFSNNCQDFLTGSLKASGMSDGGFLKQNIERLVEETPSFSKWLGKEITDLAGAGEKAYSEVADKRGGRRRFGY
jgi:hypothetical protein